MKQAFSIARKELGGYFGSPMALIFVGTFLAITLFSFFWIDTFFARGIADVRPLFERMPLMLIFLVSALPMRQWSEEQRSGTQEILLTLPVPRLQLVLGKFLAVMGLVVLSLALTLFMPLTVAILGDLDWGPVVGGYLAALLLAGAYAAIGLFVSSRTDNQIVALILSLLLGGLFYLAGTSGVTDFFGETVGSLLRALGSGSRFESVQRGVIDLRDLVYYLSLTAIFLTLNVFALQRKGWSLGERTATRRAIMTITTVLVVANLILVNVWVYPLRGLRLDLTENQEYSLSDTTKALLDNLQEPLLVRGYFSERTHPLLAPLVPEITDMLHEYEVAGKGLLQLEIVDPAQDPDKEAEANQSYGISPTPFQVAGRYETSIINSYFDILVRYGDQNEVLGFGDLIEVESTASGTDVRLRNLEYDLTSAIKKVLYGFQSVDSILASLDSPAQLALYVTPNTLPEWLSGAPEVIGQVANDIAGSSGKFNYTVIDPTAPGSQISAQELYDRYGMQPYSVSLFSPDTYYLHMVLQVGNESQVVYPTGDVTAADVRNSLEAALKRSAPGFLQVVGVWVPTEQPTQDMFGQTQQPISSWQQLPQALSQEYEVRYLDLSTGQIASDVDVLVIVAPRDMTDKQRYAIDQYLMRGGSVIVAAGNYGITIDPYAGGLSLKPLENGLQEMLASYGITVENSLVMDPQNEPFPVAVQRKVGSMTVQEIQSVNYPFFADVRSKGINSESPIVSNLQAVTLNWASPITVDETQNANREVTTLLQSTAQSWVTTDTNIQPDMDIYPNVGFATGSPNQPYDLAVSVQGTFESAFKGQASPLLDVAEGEQAPTNVPATIESSPESARLVVIGSAEFLDDTVFQISSQISMDRYLNSLTLVQNAVAWSTEDLDLLSISSRGTYTRVLNPLLENERSFWEAANYALALAALIVIGIFWNAKRRNEQPIELIKPQGAAAKSEARS